MGSSKDAGLSRMKTIKIRGWHKKEKKMYEPLVVIGTGEAIAMIYGEGAKINTLDKPPFSIDFSKDFELMLSTGLKSKSGKEIYEGDIVSWEDYPAGKEMGPRVNIETVEYGLGCYVVGVIPFETFWEESYLDFEVIGNKYMNKDLL